MRGSLRAQHILRDLPINLLVVESKLLSALEASEFRDYLALDYQGASMVLQDSLVIEDLSCEGIATIVKASTLAETANRILQQAERCNSHLLSTPNGIEQLSERELTVAKMLVEGQSNKQIALQLDINQKTVSTYKTRVMTKLGIKSAVELVRFITIK